jgi:hypothetical protein
MIDPVSAKAKAPAVERRAARRRIGAGDHRPPGRQVEQRRGHDLAADFEFRSHQHARPPGDGKVVLRRGALETSGIIAWVKGNHVGVKFDERISQLQIAAIVHRAPPKG